MKRVLSITLAMLMAIGLVLPTKALAYTYTESDPNDTGVYLSEPMKSVKFYRSGVYEYITENGTHHPNDYADVTVNGNTLEFNVVQTCGNADTCSFYAVSRDNKIQSCVTDVPISNGRYTATLDLSKFDGTQSLNISVDECESAADEYYYYDTSDCRLYKTNGSWGFKYYGSGAVGQVVNKRCMGIFENYTNPYDTSLGDWDIEQPYKDKAKQLCAGLTDDYMKAYTIYKWVTDTFHYGTGSTVDGISGRNDWNCEDFAYTMRKMCNSVGVPCVAPGGVNYTYDNLEQARNSGTNHAWNAAYANGRWILFDASAKSPFDMTYQYFCSFYTMTAAGINYYNDEGAHEEHGKHNTLTVLVDGSSIKMDAYNINDNNYVKLRDVAQILNKTGKKFSVTWDGANNAIRMVSGESYEPVGGELEVDVNGMNLLATPTTSTVYLNNQKLGLKAYSIEGFNYFKLRDIGSAINFDVDWDSNTGWILVTTTRGYSA